MPQVYELERVVALEETEFAAEEPEIQKLREVLGEGTLRAQEDSRAQEDGSHSKCMGNAA